MNISRLIWLFISFILFIKSSGQRKRQSSRKQKVSVTFRVMSFNTCHSGNCVKDGIGKIAKHIIFTNPDIVSLQEITDIKCDELLQLLGRNWQRCESTRPYLDTVIITKHAIQETYNWVDGFANEGCKILINRNRLQLPIIVWNVHLFYAFYGPYQLCYQKYPDRYQVRSIEHNYRFGELHKLLSTKLLRNQMRDADTVPIIVAGDFNSPSHLDWIKSTSGIHCNTSFQWPVTKLMADKKFVDSYRYLYPNPLQYLGYTWSPIVKYNDEKRTKLEPQDRIDYIFYQSSKLKATLSKTYVGNKPIFQIPYNILNDWPSDHAALISDFVYN